MAKRGAASELNDRNWNDEEEPEEAGTFIQASSDVMQARVIKKAKRRTANEQGGGSKPVFGGFGGLSSSTKSTGLSTPSFGGASSVNGAQEKKMEGKDSSTYLHSLKSLNESVLAWIKQHVDENPYIFLTPIFKDYQKHLEVIEAKRSATSPGSGDSKKELDSGSSQDVKDTVKPFTFDTKPTPFGSQASSNGGFKFSSSSSSTTGGFNFGSAPKTDFTSGFSFGASTSGPLSGAASSSQSSSQPAGDNKDDEEYVPPKPEVREIKEEDSLYSKRCKLYYQKDGQWVDRGVGNLHLKPVAGDKTQLLVRADTNLGNILLNIMLAPSLPMARQGKNNVSLACVPNPPLTTKPDQSSDTPVPMLIRVKTAEDADEVFAKIEERRKLLS